MHEISDQRKHGITGEILTQAKETLKKLKERSLDTSHRTVRTGPHTALHTNFTHTLIGISVL